MIIYKTIFRDLRKNIFRWFALFLLITFGVYFVVSILAASETTIKNVEEYCTDNLVEDGEFETILPLKEDAENKLRNNGLILEKQFYLDFGLDDESVLRIFKNREEINIEKADKGKIENKVYNVMLEKNFAGKNNLEPSDTINVGGKNLVITGIGSSPDYDYPIKEFTSLYSDSKTFGTAFVNETTYNELRDTRKCLNSEKYIYSYRTSDDMNTDKIKSYLDELTMDDLRFTPETESLRNLGITYTNLVDKKDNPRIGASSILVTTNRYIGIFGGIVVLVLFTYVISVFVINNVEKESVVIGALYSLGVHRRKIKMNYILLPVLITMLASVAGTILAFSDIGIKYQIDSSLAMYSVPDFKTVYSPYVMIYGLVMPSVICYLVNSVVIKKYISRTPLSLLRNEKKTAKSTSVNVKTNDFIKGFQIKQFFREIRTSATIFFGIFISLMLVVFSISLYGSLMKYSKENDEDIRYEYMYTLKYQVDDIEGEYDKCIIVPMKKDFMDYKFDVTFIGISEDSRYFDFDMPESEKNVVIGSGAALKYDLDKGDKLEVYKDETDYTFNITDKVQYSSGLTVFMDIDEMRRKFGYDEDYYNVICSENSLDIPVDAIATQTKKSDMIKYADITMESTMGTLYIALFASAAIFAIVIYLMMKIIIERSSFNISLAKIFGFNKNEIGKMYLNCNTYVVLFSLIVSLPLNKMIINAVLPSAVANYPCGFDVNIEWYYYAFICLAAAICYFIVYFLVSKRLANILPAEVLKNRE